jgi:hypothetical protein
MWKTIRFAIKMKTDVAKIFKMIPLPNSELFEKARVSGKIPKNIWTQFMKGEKSHPIYYPDGISPKILDRIYRTGWILFYINPLRILKNYPLILKPRALVNLVKVFYTTLSKKRYK